MKEGPRDQNESIVGPLIVVGILIHAPLLCGLCLLEYTMALERYEGTLLFISHDVHFIRALAQTVLHVHSGRLTPYAGDYDYYLDKSKLTDARFALTAGFTDARPKQAAAGAATPAPSAPNRPPRRSKHRSRPGHQI